MAENRTVGRIFGCIGILIIAAAFGICSGTQWISPVKLAADISADGLSPDERIVLYIRLPRVLAAALAGAALAVSGAVIQSVLGNPLAAPNIIGVNAGAGLFTVLCMALFPTAVKMLPAAAFLGALFAVMTVYGIAKKTGASRMTIVLTGKTIPAILAGIDYAVDVNTGEHIKAEKLSKNGIAVCDILLTEAIAADKFTAHKTLGELILIDRVTNMTSACGVVLELSERGNTASEKASFKNGELSARGDIFEEFYYDTSSLNVLKYQPVKATYTVGDEIPTEGESYHYPDSFDIIVLRDGVSVKVRDKKITEIIPTADYSYGGVPVVNGRGFGVKASSDEEISRFLKEYSETDEKEQSGFFAKWVRFDEYRKVIVKS